MNSPSQGVPRLAAGTPLLWYVVESVLGQGGFGITYAALDTNLHRTVAIKEYFPVAFSNRAVDGTIAPSGPAEAGDFGWGLRRFVEEARTLARFRHPHIVRVHSVFEANGTAYMVMEYEHGTSMANAVKAGTTFDEEQILALVAPLLDGLEEVHAAGFIHRDIKLDNILLREDGAPVLVDFGSARQFRDASAGELTALVTRGFAPYEQYASQDNGARQGPWSDIYSLGVVLYRLVTRRLPPDALARGMTILERDEDPLVPAAEYGDRRYSPQLLGAIDAALAFKHDARPQSVTEWRALFPTLPPVGAVTRPAAAVVPTEALSPRPAAAESPYPATARLTGAGATTAPATGAPRADLADPALARLRVLVVDDEQYIRSLVLRVLDRLGVETRLAAADSATAFAIIDDLGTCPDVILLDLRMPNMDGVEFVRHLATRSLTCGLVLMSGVEPRVLQVVEQLARAHGLTVLGTLQKPIRPEPMRELLSLYEPSMPTVPVLRSSQEPLDAREFDEGLAAGCVETHFQPKIAVTTGTVVGVETLARWRHPQRGLLGPATFVPFAEESGRMAQLTEAIMRRAFANCGAWRALGIEVPLAVNVSMENLVDFGFPDLVVDCAEAEGLTPDQLTLEVTESRLIADARRTVEILTRLRLRGVSLSIDDFGTGYASLELLKNLPFTELKVDRAFVHGASRDPGVAALLEACVSIGRKHGLHVVAEGVEDREDWQVVADLGCDTVQGYYVAKPMLGDDLPGWIAARRGAD